MRAVLLSMTDLQIFGMKERFGVRRTPRRSSLLGRSRRLGVVGERAHQGDAAAVPDELWEVRVITVLQGERAAVAGKPNPLPPPVFKALLSDHDMASRDLVPRAGQAAGSWQAVLVAVL